MERGSFVYVELTGKVKSTGEVFETTKEEVAKASGIYREGVKYKPRLVIVGEGMLLKRLEEELEKMEVGEKRLVELKPEEAFGERREDLVKLLPLSEFRERNVKPKPGDVVYFNGVPARVLSVSGGRVSVDFNHPLAGKEVVYEIEIEGVVEDDKEKVKALVEELTGLGEGKFKLEFGEKRVRILTERLDVPPTTKARIASLIKTWIKSFESVSFEVKF